MKTEKKFIRMGIIYAVLVIAIVVGSLVYGDNEASVSEDGYWTQNNVGEVLSLAVKDGEITQKFTTMYGNLTQIILRFMDYSAEDQSVLTVTIDDESGTQLYYYSIETSYLSGENFYLIAYLEEGLKKGNECTIHISLDSTESDIVVLAVPESNLSSVGALSQDGEEAEDSVLYFYQEYTIKFFWQWLWFAALGILTVVFGLYLVCREKWQIQLIDDTVSVASIFVAYLEIELLSGNLSNIVWKYAAVNILIIAGIYLLFRAIMKRAAFYVIVLLSFVAAVGNYYVTEFRGSDLQVLDILSIGTAADVAGNYTFDFSGAVYTACLFTVCLLCIHLEATFQLKAFSEEKKKPIYELERLVCAVAGIWVFVLVGNRFMPRDAEFMNYFTLSNTFSELGWSYTNAYLVTNSRLTKPDGYSSESIAAILEELETESAEAEEEEEQEDVIVPQNIIVIMNESFSDLSVIGDFAVSQDYMPFLHSLTENTVKGNLHVNVFGGNTCNTEYEFLTGNTMYFLPTGRIAYFNYCKSNEAGITQILSDQGYYTVAMHPYSGSNWNREQVYTAMGFDEFLDLDYFTDADKLRGFVSDVGDYEKLIEYYENYTGEEKLFIFNVTMQNHGGYDVNNGSLDIKVECEDYDSNVVDTYLTLIYESDQAFAMLVDYFSEVEEPTMIVMFGDHMASLPDAFYEMLYGKELADRTYEEMELMQETFYVIWTNYDSDFEEMPDISANYLGSWILELAGLEMPEYNQFLVNQMRQIPVVGKYGMYDAQGNFVQYGEAGEWLSDYEILQYLRISDRSSEWYRIFSLQ